MSGLGSWLVDSLVPPGGLLLSLVGAYFDESVNAAEHGQPPMLSVAGYLFTEDAARAFDAQWRVLLVKYELDHFSMADCNSQWGEFEKYSDAECIEIQKEFFAVLKRHALQGFAASFDLAHAGLLPSAKTHGIEIVSPYTFCCYWCLFYGRTWARAVNFRGQIAYLYEQGYLKQPEFARVIGDIFANEELKAHFFCAAHGFADKRKATQLQAGDILAWQWRNHVTKRMQGTYKMRGDLLSLLDIPTHKIDFDQAKIVEFIELVRRPS